MSLYRGDFLQGFQIKDSDEFEYWLAAEQERLREKAVAALRMLIDGYLERGEHRAGIQYAQRLVAIDPLSEDAHQKLMRLYSLSGRRSRALAQYEDLASVLRRELDVDPMPETMALQQRILRQESSHPLGTGSGEEGGPVIPMAGRDSEYGQLDRSMQSALAGKTLLSFVEGEPGVGKTRLIRSLLDALSSQPGTLVLKGSCLDVLPESYQPLSGALRSVLAQGDLSEGMLRRLDAETSQRCRWWCPSSPPSRRHRRPRAAAVRSSAGASGSTRRSRACSPSCARAPTAIPAGSPCCSTTSSAPTPR